MELVKSAGRPTVCPSDSRRNWLLGVRELTNLRLSSNPSLSPAEKSPARSMNGGRAAQLAAGRPVPLSTARSTARPLPAGSASLSVRLRMPDAGELSVDDHVQGTRDGGN